MPLAACGDWPPIRVLGDTPRFANCQGCHGSAVTVAFDTAAKRYDTHFASLSINCESCHGPGRRHVQLARAGRLFRSADIGMTALSTLTKDQSIRVCYQCHALKDQLRAGYVSGDSLERYYALALPLLGDTPLAPDGRVRTFAYQETQRYSECYLNGGMRCTRAHQPGHRAGRCGRYRGRSNELATEHLGGSHRAPRILQPRECLFAAWRMSKAIVEYQTAAMLDRGLTPAHLNLARALVAPRRYSEALVEVRTGLAFDSSDTNARALRDALQGAMVGVRRR